MTLSVEDIHAAGHSDGLGGDVRGHAVLALQEDRLALWTLTATGQRSGAWVEAERLRPERARALLTLVERRLIVTAKESTDGCPVELLAEVADVRLPETLIALRTSVFDLFREISGVRQELAGLTTAASSKGLDYRLVLDGLPGEESAALVHLGAVPLVGPEPVTTTVLRRCQLVALAAQAWEETEGVRLRRKALLDHGGPTARALPEDWLDRLRRAGSQRIDV
jgi:hypothetical protein